MSTWGKVFPGRRYSKCKSLEPGVVVVLSRSHVQLFATPWTAAHQASLSFPICWSLFRLLSIESRMPSNHLILCCPFSFFSQSCPASGSFPMRRLFVSGGQSIGASASVLPMNIQSWLSLGLTGLISLLSKGLSRVFSRTTVQKHKECLVISRSSKEDGRSPPPGDLSDPGTELESLMSSALADRFFTTSTTWKPC